MLAGVALLGAAWGCRHMPHERIFCNTDRECPRRHKCVDAGGGERDPWRECHRFEDGRFLPEESRRGGSAPRT